MTPKVCRPKLQKWDWVWFVLFNDTWSQYRHSVSCMTILFLNFHITRSDIKATPNKRLSISLVITCTFILLRGFCVGMYGLTYSLYPPQRNELEWTWFCGECKEANIAQYIDVQYKIASTCRLQGHGLPQIYTCPNRRGNVKINRKLYGDNPGHA